MLNYAVLCKAILYNIVQYNAILCYTIVIVLLEVRLNYLELVLNYIIG